MESGAITGVGNTRGIAFQVWGTMKSSDLYILSVRFLLDIQVEVPHITLKECVCACACVRAYACVRMRVSRGRGPHCKSSPGSVRT